MLTHSTGDHEAFRISVEVSNRRADRWDPSFHPVLATPTTRLRKLRPDDRASLVALFTEHGHVEGTIDAPKHFAEESTRRWLAARMAEEQMGYALHWAVCLLSEDRPVGYVGLQDIDFHHRQAELCFWLAPISNSDDFQLDVTQTALAYAFTTMGLNSMRAVTIPGQVRPEAALTILGMSQLQPPAKAGSVWTRFDDVHIWTIDRHHWAQHRR
jgi:RimJ/RimL family protein N-acetyltransferase